MTHDAHDGRADPGSLRTPRLRRLSLAAISLLGLTTLATLGACGGGGGGGGGGEPQGLPLAVVRTTPPIFQIGMSATWWITARGGTPPYAFRVAPGSGVPPAGLSMLVSGQISGKATKPGSSAFVVEVTDAAAPSSMASLLVVLQVGGFDVRVLGLDTPDPWTRTSYVLFAPDGDDPVAFQIIRSAAGSSIEDGDPAARTATYVAGPLPGFDLLHVSKPNGEWTEIALDVIENPLPNAGAIFGATDVWSVRFAGKEDATHAFASDFDASLARLGLRSPTGTSERGTDADLYAKFYVEAAVHRRLNELFLNGADGTPAPLGLRISFPFDEPDLPHLAPGEGRQVAAAPGAYNVIGVQAGVTEASSLALSFADGPWNANLESATPLPGGLRRGVFVDGITARLSSGFSSSALAATPLGEPDVPSLRALAFGLPNPGGRYDEVKRVADGFANVLAILIAREVGHCVGLSDGAGIMAFDPAWLAVPGASPSFVESDVTSLRAALPGFGR